VGIDEFVPDPWPSDVVTRLDDWKQGDLLAAELGVWLADAGLADPVTGVPSRGQKGTFRAVRASLSDTGYFALTSQTCDIAVSGPGMRHPFVQVSPLRDVGAAFPEKLSLIREGQVVEYFYVTNPPLPGAQWAVDLRVSVPISKAILVNATPVPGFATSDDEIAFGERIANKYERPALHDLIAKDVLNALERCIIRARGTQTWCDDIEQLRMIVEGPRLHPLRVGLLVITEVPLHPRERKPLREEWKSFKKRLEAVGIMQAPISFRTLQHLSIDQYRRSLPLNIPALRKGKFA
jgi:hypothetical protein